MGNEGWEIVVSFILIFGGMKRGGGRGNKYFCVMAVPAAATAVLPLRADKWNGRRDCDDEYGWGMRDGK